MPIRPSPSERYAFEVVSRVLGVAIELYDDNSAPRMVDGRGTNSDGSEVAVEVTRVTDQDFRRLWAALGNRCALTAISRREWRIRLTFGAQVSKYDADVQEIIDACEAAGVWTSDDLDTSVLSRGAQRLAAASHIEALPIGEGGLLERRVQESFGRSTAFVPGIEVLEQEILALYQDANVIRHIEKLRSDPAEHRHLFLALDFSSLTASLEDAVATGRDPSELPPLVPQGLTAVWLGTALNQHNVWVGTIRGWMNEHYPELAPRASTT